MFNQLDNLISGLLDRGYEEAARQTLNRLGASLSSGRVAARLAEMDEEALRLLLADEKLMPDNAVLVALTADLERELRRGAAMIDAAAGEIQGQGTAAAGQITRELALPGLDDKALARLGVGWNVPDPEAVNELIGITGSFEWDDEMARFPGMILETVNNQAVRGMIEGWGPQKTARELRRVAEGLAPHQANNIMRTLQLQSYRRATAIHQKANEDILTGIIRVAVLDSRTCLACIALHGEELPVGAVVADHHQGRCTSIGVVRGRERTVATGAEWLEGMTDEELEGMAAFQRSPGALEALRSGKANIQDFVQRYDDPVFGEMVRQGGIARALENKVARRAARRVSAGEVLTGEGMKADDPAAFEDIATKQELTDYLFEGGLRADYMWAVRVRNERDEFDDALGIGADGLVTVDKDVLYEYIKDYVKESRSIEESRYHLANSMQWVLKNEAGIEVSVEEADRVINADEGRRAEALLKLAQVSKLRLTLPQRARLERAVNGEYLDMRFEEVGELGTIVNAMRRAGANLSGIRKDSAEYRSLRENFDRNTGRYDRWR